MKSEAALLTDTGGPDECLQLLTEPDLTPTLCPRGETNQRLIYGCERLGDSDLFLRTHGSKTWESAGHEPLLHHTDFNL